MTDAYNKPVLETHSLCVGYAGVPVVSGVEFNVRPGSIVMIIGPNGAGKSTILRTLAAQQASLGGTILLAGKRMEDMSAQELALTRSVMLTDRPHTELLTCQDVVQMGRHPHTGRLGMLGKEDLRQVEDALRTVGAWELRDHDFMHISDGQRQRVMLARALCQEPRLLLLDEPTSHLDVRFQIDLLRVLRTLASTSDLGIVMSVHELPLARQASDWVVCVKNGSVLCAGTPDEVFVPKVIDDLFDLEPGTYDARTGAIRLDPLGTPHKRAEGHA